MGNTSAHTMGAAESSNKSKEEYLQKMSELRGRFYECHHQARDVVQALESQQHIVSEILEQDKGTKSPKEARPKSPTGSSARRKDDCDQCADENEGTNVDERQTHVKRTEKDLHIRDGMKTILDDSKTNALNMSRRLKNDCDTLKRLIEREFGEDHTQCKIAKDNNERRQSQATASKSCNSCSKLSDELNRTKQEILQLRSQSKTLIESKTEFEKKYWSVKGSLDAADSDYDKLDRKYKDVETKYRRLERENQKMANKPWSFFPNKSANAQLYCPRRGELSGMVSNEVTKQLVSKFSSINTDLALHAVESPGDIKQDRPVVVLCINSSRLGTDVSNALAGIHLSGMVAVVILHHKDIHALPNQPSERVLTSSEYKQLGGIYDMAFLSGKGIYTCEWNTTAVENIVRFISAYNP